MRRRTHLVIGVLLFLVFDSLFGYIHPVSTILFVFGFLGVTIGAIVPDILEPATSSRHRGFFHSRRVLRITGIGFLVATIIGILCPGSSGLSGVYPLSCFFLGYGSHLLADSCTRAGLPR